MMFAKDVEYYTIILSRPFFRGHAVEYGPMPKVVVALPNIGGALCSKPQSLARAD